VAGSRANLARANARKAALKQEQEKAQLAVAQEAVANHEDYWTNLLDGEQTDLPGTDGKPGPGLTRRHGQELFAGVTPAVEAAQARASQLLKALPSGARAKAAGKMHESMQRFQDALTRYEAPEREAFYVGTYNQGQDQRLRSTLVESKTGITYVGGQLDTTVVDQALGDIEQRVRVFATEHPEMVRGMTVGQFVSAELAVRRSELHQGVISSLLSQEKDTEASDYLKRYEDQISGPALNQLRDNVSNSHEQGQNLRLAGQLAEAMPIDVGARATIGPAAMLQARLDKLDTVSESQGWDAERRKAARAVVRSQAAQELADANAVHDEVFRALDDELVSLRGNMAMLQQTRPDEWANATGPERRGLWTRARQFLGQRRDRDRLTLEAELRTQSYSDPEGFKRRNLLYDGALLGGKKFDTWHKLQKQMMDGETELRGGALSVPKAVDGVLDSVYPNVKPGDGRWIDRVEFARQLDEAIALAQAPDGGPGTSRGGLNRKLSGLEVANLLKPLLEERIKETGVIWDSTFRMIDLSDIPAADRLRIAAELQSRGHPITPEAIRESWDNAENANPQR